MGVSRLAGIPGFNIDRVAAAAESDSDIPRMENLDTDRRPTAAGVAATREAIERCACRSARALNAELAAVWPNIKVKKDAPPDAERRKDVPGKRKLLER